MPKTTAPLTGSQRQARHKETLLRYLTEIIRNQLRIEAKIDKLANEKGVPLANAPVYIKNSPTESESLSSKEEQVRKIQETFFPDSSLPASPPARTNGNGFYPDLSAAATAFRKKGAFE